MADKFNFGGGGLAGRHKTYEWWVDDKKWKVYMTALDDGRFYIGMSGKTGKQWDNYFGSSKIVKEYKGEKAKRVLYSYEKKSHAKYRELLLQIQHINDDDCLNGIINVRIRREWLKGFK